MKINLLWIYSSLSLCDSYICEENVTLLQVTSADSTLWSPSGCSFVIASPACGRSPSDILPAASDVTDVREEPVRPESPMEILGRGGTGGRQLVEVPVPRRRPDVGK